MKSKTCLDRPSKRRQKAGNENGRIVHTPPKTTTASLELIEKTRHLMERTISFVANSDFRRHNFEQRLSEIRPASLDAEADFSERKPGVAFVSGLVQARLLTPDEERYLFLWMNYLKHRAERNRRKLDLRHPDASLVRRIESDLEQATQIRNRIVLGNSRLIVALSRKLAVSIDQLSDLIGEGMPPLIRAVELFDISLGNRFSTYATWAVRNQMLRWVKRNRNLREYSPGESSPSLENFPDDRPVVESTDVAPQLRMSAVNRLMQSLTERERAIVAARFGLDGQPAGQSLADISTLVGLSKERVRQILLLSLVKLRGLISYDEFDAIS